MPNTEPSKPYIHVVAGIIRDPDDPQKIFITRRQQGQHLENLWEFPGGKVEPTESRFHALRRELKEETGIQVVSAEPFFCVLHDYKDKSIYLDLWEIKTFQGHARPSLWIDWEQITDGSTEERLSLMAALVLAAENEEQKYGLRLPGETIEQDFGNAHKHLCLQALAVFRQSDLNTEFGREN